MISVDRGSWRRPQRPEAAIQCCYKVLSQGAVYKFALHKKKKKKQKDLILFLFSNFVLICVALLSRDTKINTVKYVVVMQ